MVVEVYVDDGYSGLNFDRPGWNEMIGLAETGKVKTVIVFRQAVAWRFPCRVQEASALHRLFRCKPCPIRSTGRDYPRPAACADLGGLHLFHSL